jgi:hypothetical protein
MQQLGYSQFSLTQEICKLRAGDGEVLPDIKYQSSFRQAIADPDNVRHRIAEDLVKVLDGNIIFRWNNRQEVKVDWFFSPPPQSQSVLHL